MVKKKIGAADAAKEWIELKAQVKEIERRLSELKAVIEPALAEAPEKTAEFHGWRFSLCQFEKESFLLSKAKAKIDGRVLAPYISISNVTQIRTSWQGGDRELGR